MAIINSVSVKTSDIYLSARVATILFILVLLSGADQLAFKVAGLTVRAVFPVAAIIFIVYFFDIKIIYSASLRFTIFLLTVIPSFLYSHALEKSFSYLLWLVLSYIFFVVMIEGLCLKVVDERKFSLYEVLLSCFRFQLVWSFASVAFGAYERPQFLYYEPSYFSIALVIYVIIIFDRVVKKELGRVDWLDLFLIFTYVALSQSATFLMALIFSAMLVFPVVKIRRFGLLLVLFILLIYGYIFFVDDINTIIVRGVINGDLDLKELLLRGGNRFPRGLVAKDVFFDNPIFGVGIGAYEAYIADRTVDIYSVFEWNSAEGLPAINIYLELLATIGVFGFSGFMIFIWTWLRWIFGRGFWSPLSKAMIVMMILLMFEGNYLRAYFWILLGLILVEKKNFESATAPYP